MSDKINKQEIYLKLAKKLCPHPAYENFDCGKCGYYIYGVAPIKCSKVADVFELLEKYGIEIE